MGNFDSAVLLVLVGAAAVLVGAGYSISVGNLVLTSSHGGPARSFVAICVGLVLIAVGALLKTDQLGGGGIGLGAVAIGVGPLLAAIVGLLMSIRWRRDRAKDIRPPVFSVADAAWSDAMTDREMTPHWRRQPGSVPTSDVDLDADLEQK